MDLDVFVAAHQGEWRRLEELVKRARRARHLQGAEVDELVELYQRTATHLSVLQGAGPDPVVIGKLSVLVAQARNVVVGSRQAAWRDAARFLRVDFPAVLYRTRWWWTAVGAVFLLISFGWAAFLVSEPAALASLVPPEDVEQLVNEDFANYYSSAPGQDFAARVFTNNALIAAACVASGALLGLPVFFLIYQNAVSIGVVGALMVSNGKADVFFGLILPHGLLELTSIFVAGGLGLRLGWSVIDPGLRTRAQAFAEDGRALISGAIGLALMLFISGLIEAFVTPSGFPTWLRIGIGVTAEVLFLVVVFTLGKRAAQAGATGDLDASLLSAQVPRSA